MNRLAVVVLTYNESAHIADCIASAQFADTVIAFDSHSTDDTAQKASAAGAHVIQHPFENYASQRNAALHAAADFADWVLFIDADERVTPELAAEVRQAVEKPAYAAWRIPRHNYIFGRLTRGAGWYPDYQTRLLKIGAARLDPDRHVHEVVLTDEPVGTLSGHLIHHNYRDTAHFAEKQRKYTAYEARIMHQQGIRPKLRNYILQPLRHFWWRFVILKGYTDGLHGLRLSIYMAWYEFRKYRLLHQLCVDSKRE
jgi:(heptosyl)LPS beta-1,4-glucosyltransferase